MYHFRERRLGRRVVCGGLKGAVGVGLFALLAVLACSDSSDDDIGSSDQPRIQAATYVDVDGNGVDFRDVLLVQFDDEVVVQGSSVNGFVFDDRSDSLGDGAFMQQSLPASEWVEILLGTDPTLFPANPNPESASAIDVRGGANRVEVVGTNGFVAGSNKKFVTVVETTTADPVLSEVRFTDADNDGILENGDLLVAAFDKPIVVPVGATVVQNFGLPVAGDSFGASPQLSASTSLNTNRSSTVTLGVGASLTIDGNFDAASTTSGSSSGVLVEPTATITDTVASTPNTIEANVTSDIFENDATTFGNGREADTVLGNPDAFTPALTAQGVNEPGGADSFIGTLNIDGDSLDVNLFFLADRLNDRVLVFQGVPGGNFPAASWVLGQPDLTTGTRKDLTDPSPVPATASNMLAPADVAFDATNNRFYVADTGNNRILGWNNLFTINGDANSLVLQNGRAADFILGQGSASDRDPNRGRPTPEANSFWSPSGLSIGAARLAVADRGNSRVLVFASLPATGDVNAGLVLGQSNFNSGDPNRGGSPGAGTMNLPADVFLSLAVSINGSLGSVFVADAANNRVLVFETLNPAIGADADAVLGQASFASVASGTTAAGLDGPAGVVVDAATSLIYVADRENNRTMVYDASGGLANGDPGTAIGQADNVSGEPNRGGAPGGDTQFAPSNGLVIAGTVLVVSDSLNHRVLVFGGVAPPTVDTAATSVIGQPDFSRSDRNAQLTSRPTKGLITSGQLILADTDNHRVLIYNTVPMSTDTVPNVVLGQADLFSSLPNRGGTPAANTLRLPTGLATDGVRLAVSDSGNNRILIWNTVPTTDGTAADVVLGQPDMTSNLPNAGDVTEQDTLATPEGLFVSASTDQLFVADRKNSRVLIFDGFSTVGDFDPASVVVGQRDFTERQPNQGVGVSAESMNEPRDVTVGDGRLYVADTENNRVLYWSSVPKSNGRRASSVYGQPDFTSRGSGNPSPGSMRAPVGLSMDGAASLLVVSDALNNRVIIFEEVNPNSNKPRPSADFVLGQRSLFENGANQGSSTPNFATLLAPAGIFFNGYELFVADTGNGRLLTYR